MEGLRRLAIKAAGRIAAISHLTGNKQEQSDRFNFYKRPNMELKYGAPLVKHCHPSSEFVYAVVFGIYGILFFTGRAHKTD